MITLYELLTHERDHIKSYPLILNGLTLNFISLVKSVAIFLECS